MKILRAKRALKEPFWKYKAFGIPAKQFHDNDVVQTRCSYRNMAGELQFPFLYQITSEKALTHPACRRIGNKVIVPIALWDMIEEG